MEENNEKDLKKNRDDGSMDAFFELFGEFESLDEKVKKENDLDKLKQILKEEYLQEGRIYLNLSTLEENQLVIKALLQIGLIGQISNKLPLELDSIEILSNDEIDELVSSGHRIELKKLNGLTQEKINHLINGVEIDGDSIGKYSQKEISAIMIVMECLKEKIPEGVDGDYKLLYGYDAIGRFADYDRRGCDDNEQSTKEDVKLTRSLKGVFLQGRAVCAGYALAAEKFLNYIGVETKRVSGMGYTVDGRSGEHAWFISKLKEKWYHCDLTWDYMDLREEKKPEYCLKSDSEIEKDHKISERSRKQIGDIKCPESYPRDKMKAILREINQHRGNEQQENNIGMEIWEKISSQENSYIYEQTLKDLRDIINRNIEPEKIQENEGQDR